VRAHPAGALHGDVAPLSSAAVAPPADLNALSPHIWPMGARRHDGALMLGDVDVRDLAAEHGTPSYVVVEADVRDRCRAYRAAFGDDTDIYYAAKAFLSRAAVRWMQEEGLGLDVSTGGELHLALAAGFPAERILVHGNNKSLAELHAAVSSGVGRIVLDSDTEIARLAHVAKALGVRQKVLVRVTVGVEAHTHEFIATAHEDQKFGFSLTSGAALEAVRRVSMLPSLELVGLHSHIGSQIFDSAGFDVAAHRVVALLATVRDTLGLTLPELDLGGGSASPTSPTTTRPSRSTSPSSCGTSFIASAWQTTCRCRGSRSSPAGRSSVPAASRSMRSAPSRMSTASAPMSASTAA
jgi:diaminopimelate decarboxylase